MQRIHAGGLVLEPSLSSGQAEPRQGTAVLRLFGSERVDGPSFLAAAACEMYRWILPQTLEIFDPTEARALRIGGTLSEGRLDLTVTSGVPAFIPGTRLRLVEAPNDPVTRDWIGAFPEPPNITAQILRSIGVHKDPLEVIRGVLPLAAMTAKARLERAWRAPV